MNTQTKPKRNATNWAVYQIYTKIYGVESYTSSTDERAHEMARNAQNAYEKAGVDCQWLGKV